MTDIVRHERSVQGQCMRGDQQVHGADGRALAFELVPDAPVMRRAGDGVVVIDVEWHQDLSDRGHFRFVVSAVARAKLQL